jgi:hypothetical protein
VPLFLEVMAEYPFMSREAFAQLVASFLSTSNPAYRRKAIIIQEDYDMIINILKKPDNTSIATSKDRFWVKHNFYLRDIGTVQNPIIQVMTQEKENEWPDRIICAFESLYDILG